MIITLPMDAPMPLTEEGEKFPLLMIHSQGAEKLSSYADTHTELLGALIDGYADISDDAQGHQAALYARYDHALMVAALVQSHLAVVATDEGRWHPGVSNEDELTAIMCDRTIPFAGIPAADGSINRQWRCVVPLVLIATDYAPYTDLPRPTGQILWLDPALESVYLQDLMGVGLIKLLAQQ